MTKFYTNKLWDELEVNNRGNIIAKAWQTLFNAFGKKALKD